MEEFTHRSCARVVAFINLAGTMWIIVILAVFLGFGAESQNNFEKLAIIVDWLVSESLSAIVLITTTRKSVEARKAFQRARCWIEITGLICGIWCIILYMTGSFVIPAILIAVRIPMVCCVRLFVMELKESMETGKVQEEMHGENENSNQLQEDDSI